MHFQDVKTNIDKRVITNTNPCNRKQIRNILIETLSKDCNESTLIDETGPLKDSSIKASPLEEFYWTKHHKNPSIRIYGGVLFSKITSDGRD